MKHLAVGSAENSKLKILPLFFPIFPIHEPYFLMSYVEAFSCCGSTVDQRTPP